MKKRILTWLLAMLTVCSILPAAAWADVETKGPCGAQGDNVGWAWSSANDGTLTIGGEGAMADFDSANPIKAAPWSQLEYTTVNFAGNITHIGSYSFPKSKVGRFLAVGHTVRLPSSVTSIGQGAFYGCVYMQDVILPADLTVLESAVFKGCNDLRYITLPVGVKRIERETFMGCSSMTNIVIQAADLSYIGTDAFLGCSSLTDVYFRGSKAQWGKILAGAGNSVLTTVNVHYNYTGSVAPTLGTPDLTLTRDVQTDKPCLNWTAVEGASQYEVYRSATGAADSFKLIHSTTSTAYVDTSAVGGTTYYYTVRAINGLKFGLDSDPQSMTCPAAPARPSLTLTTDRSGKPVLKWTSVKDATAYEVFRSTTGAAGSFSIVRRTSYLTWTDTNTEMDKTYYYVVRAKNGILCGKFSPAQSVKCPIILSVPSMTLDLNKSTGKPVISWTSVPFATQYEIYRSATGADKSYRIIRRTALLNYTDTTAASGTTYYYVVRAMRGTGNSAIYSRFCKAQSTTSAVLPSTPTVTLRIDDTTGKPVISWSKTANAAQYEIYRSTTGADKSYRIIRRTALLNYTDTTAVAGTTYYYVVRAIQGTSPNIFRGRFCPAQSIRCAAVPGVPDMALTTDIDTGHIVISWSAATDAAQYEVFRSTDSSSFSSVCRTAALTWTDPNTESGVTYYYKVRGITDSVKGAFCEAQSILFTAQDIIANGSCGDNVTWKLLGSGTMLIIGRGPMWDYGLSYTYGNDTPWAKAELLSDINEVVIRPGVTSIGSWAFSSCDNLTNVIISNSVLSVGSYTFAYCDSLQNITIPDSVSTIGSSVFSSCYSLCSVTIPNSVTTIGSYAFNDCRMLANIAIPSSVETIGMWAFYGCERLATVTIAKGVTSIGEGAFGRCRKLTSLIIPDGVTSINDSLFSACTSLTDITIPGSVTAIGRCAFEVCDSLVNVNISDGVISIGDYAFRGCISLTRIVIPHSVTSIGQCAFSGCNRLTGITLPNGITSIGNSAFNECKSLVSVVIPNGVTSIERDTFSWCSSLSSVAIPNSVKSIGESAFFYCKNLEKIYYAGSQENWATISISSGNEYLFAPTTILYNQTEPWR